MRARLSAIAASDSAVNATPYPLRATSTTSAMVTAPIPTSMVRVAVWVAGVAFMGLQ